MARVPSACRIPGGSVKAAGGALLAGGVLVAGCAAAPLVIGLLASVAVAGGRTPSGAGGAYCISPLLQRRPARASKEKRCRWNDERSQ